MIARLALRSTGSLARLATLTGHAHLPLLLLAVFIQFVSVALNLIGIAVWLAVFAGAFWMPAMLGSAAVAATALDLRRATLAVAGPYLAWLAVVGRSLWIQLEHLL